MTIDINRHVLGNAEAERREWAREQKRIEEEGAAELRRLRARDLASADAEERLARLERFVEMKLGPVVLPEDEAPPYARGPFTNAEIELVAERAGVALTDVEAVLVGRPCWAGKRARIVAEFDGLRAFLDTPEPEAPSEQLPVLPESANPGDWAWQQYEEESNRWHRLNREREEWRRRRRDREIALLAEGKAPPSPQSSPRRRLSHGCSEPTTARALRDARRR